MGRLILDISVLVAAERSGVRLDELIADDDDVAIAAVTVAELLVGVGLADGKRRRARKAFVDEVTTAIPMEPYDAETARAHADLLLHARRSGTPRGAHDLLVAATAVVRRRAVVTADPSGFAGLPGVAVAG